MQSKTCFKCGDLKSLNEFHKHPRMADGHLNKCKSCACQDVSANRKLRHDYYIAFDKARNMLPHRVAKRKEWVVDNRGASNDIKRRYSQRNPEKMYAIGKVAKAIKKGILKRMPCEVCGCKTTHGHHHDYTKPLDVRWLCPKCHKAEHHKIKSK